LDEEGMLVSVHCEKVKLHLFPRAGQHPLC